tara:strand:+ start:42 stop:662 length:621 start_codon:yes stop_codon:yes gene_type:complete
MTKKIDILASIKTGNEIDTSEPETIFTMEIGTTLNVRIVRLENRGFFPRKSTNPSFNLHYTADSIEDGFFGLSLGQTGKEDYNAIRGSGEVSRPHSKDPASYEYNWSYGERKSNQLAIATKLLTELLGGDITQDVDKLTAEDIKSFEEGDWKNAPYSMKGDTPIISWEFQLSRLVGLNLVLKKINQYEYTDNLGAIRQSPEFVPVF